jgi:hypothetical protein
MPPCPRRLPLLRVYLLPLKVFPLVLRACPLPPKASLPTATLALLLQDLRVFPPPPRAFLPVPKACPLDPRVSLLLPRVFPPTVLLLPLLSPPPMLMPPCPLLPQPPLLQPRAFLPTVTVLPLLRACLLHRRAFPQDLKVSLLNLKACLPDLKVFPLPRKVSPPDLRASPLLLRVFPPTVALLLSPRLPLSCPFLLLPRTPMRLPTTCPRSVSTGALQLVVLLLPCPLALLLLLDRCLPSGTLATGRLLFPFRLRLAPIFPSLPQLVPLPSLFTALTSVPLPRALLM